VRVRREWHPPPSIDDGRAPDHWGWSAEAAREDNRHGACQGRHLIDRGLNAAAAMDAGMIPPPGELSSAGGAHLGMAPASGRLARAPRGLALPRRLTRGRKWKPSGVQDTAQDRKPTDAPTPHPEAVGREANTAARHTPTANHIDQFESHLPRKSHVKSAQRVDC
jgi:hypothetical protein